jgi:hypothetical protein
MNALFMKKPKEPAAKLTGLGHGRASVSQEAHHFQTIPTLGKTENVHFGVHIR